MANLDFTGICWEWTGHLRDGYGLLAATRSDGRPTTANVHRVVWEELVGLISDGLQLDHLCRNRRCANPDHLEPVTQAVNVRRGASVHRRLDVACSKGHIRTPENTYLPPTGRRACLVCRRAAKAAYRARLVVAA